jgi:hypothetical protein
MRFKINSTGAIILADYAFMDAHYPNNYTLQVEPETPEVHHITSYAYWNRWPIAKRQAFKQAAKTTIAFEDFIDMVNGAQYVDLDLQALKDAHVQIVSATMLTQAESNVILSTVIQPIELP